MTASSGQALENALLANPDDLAAHAAYADWLIEQGDPRGEFIQVQLALEDPKKPAEERKKLQDREQELLTKHQREWLGELAPFLIDSQRPAAPEWHQPQPHQYSFARGWLDKLHIPEIFVNLGRAMVRAPEGRLLQDLAIERVAYFDPNGQYSSDSFDPGDDVPPAEHNPGICPLLKIERLTNLRRFQFGTKESDEFHEGKYYSWSCGAYGEHVPQLVARMPRLEELFLFANNVPTGELFRLPSLQNLRILQVYHAHVYDLDALAHNPALSSLTHLILHPKALGAWSEDEGPYIKREGVRTILFSPYLKNLTHLQLRLTDLGDTGCEEIVKSGILRRLKWLDLRHGSITDAGARILAACPDLANLQHLELTRNALTPDGIAALRHIVPNLVADYQQTPEELEAGEYLYEGDIE